MIGRLEILSNFAPDFVQECSVFLICYLDKYVVFKNQKALDSSA